MTFDLAKFRLVYPQFNTADEALVLALAEQAECYLPRGCECCLDQLIMLLVAHMLSIRTASGAGGGLAVASASEGGISVSLAMPANADARGQWLNITPFGQQYAALAARCGKGKAAAGLFVGGYPEGDAFRRVYGVFPRRKL